MDRPVLCGEQLCFSYGERRIFQEVSLAVGRGELTMMLGPNGSGKTTLLRLLSGFLSPDSGQIMLAGRNLTQYGARARAAMLGVVPQTPPPALDFTVRDLVMLGCHAKLPQLSPPSPEDRQRVDEAMAALDLTALADRPANRLSGGERQRVMLAGALALAPEALLLDEPTSALDPHHRLLVMRLLKDYARDHAVLMITHDFELAGVFAEQLLLVDGTGCLEAGPPELLLTAATLTRIYRTPAEVLLREGRRRIFWT